VCGCQAVLLCAVMCCLFCADVCCLLWAVLLCATRCVFEAVLFPVLLVHWREGIVVYSNVFPFVFSGLSCLGWVCVCDVFAGGQWRRVPISRAAPHSMRDWRCMCHIV
jgi:uncharacterized membrane protein